jgi:ribonuclease PH
MTRSPDEIRPVRIRRRFTRTAPGSVLYQAGNTIVLCTASIDNELPAWLKDSGRGWITAEYNMLPGSTTPRKPRERQRIDGRTTEIQRLIGRSLRAVADLDALGPRQVLVDCDVLQADGGTRTASINGAFIAVVDALASIRRQLPSRDKYPLVDNVAAISVGLVDGRCVVDLDYRMDAAADVDMNIVMTGAGRFVEIQGTGEEATFTDRQLSSMLQAGRAAAAELTQIQKAALGARWPF